MDPWSDLMKNWYSAGGFLIYWAQMTSMQNSVLNQTQLVLTRTLQRFFSYNFTCEIIILFLNLCFSINTIVPIWDRLWEEAKQKKGKPPGVFLVLFKAFGWTFLTGGAWQLSYLLLQFVSPLLLNLIISFVQVKLNEHIVVNVRQKVT